MSAKLQIEEREKKRQTFTLQELNEMPSETKTYKSVGKMFLSVPCGDLKKSLSDEIAKLDEDLVKLTVQITSLVYV